MVQLSDWEQWLVISLVSLLTMLETKLKKNATAVAACKAAVTFLQDLLAGQISVEAA